jgi:hypothetical protein
MNDNPPREYDVSKPDEIERLFRETIGYLETCKHQHHGTDVTGRSFAVAAFRKLRDLLP